MTLTGDSRATRSRTAVKAVSTDDGNQGPWPRILEQLPEYEPDTLMLSLEFYRESILRRVVDDRGRVTVAMVDRRSRPRPFGRRLAGERHSARR